MKRIILASGSPRRKELLTQIGIEYEVIVSDVDETIEGTVMPDQVPLLLSARKAGSVFEKVNDENALVIGADTIVCQDGIILGKPKDESDAFSMLKKLAGNKHKVYTGVSLVYSEQGKMQIKTFVEETTVSVSDMSENEIREYIASGDPMDKAGAYGIQGAFAKFINNISGDYYNVVGMPVAKLYENIKKI